MTLTAASRAARAVLLPDPRTEGQGLRIPTKPRLLGTSTKIEKGLKRGILTTVLYLSPSDEAGFVNLCPWASPECRAACLGHSSGQMVFSSSRNSRIWKTLLWKFHRAEFNALLTAEIAAHQARAQRRGLRCAVRLDGTSDIGIAGDFALRFPAIQFYDYTKSIRRATGVRPPNWHITFSFSGHNLEEALRILRTGGNVAVVFRTKDPAELPERWHGFRVIDADATDARFEDPPGTVAGLTFKGSRLSEAGPFAVPV